MADTKLNNAGAEAEAEAAVISYCLGSRLSHGWRRRRKKSRKTCLLSFSHQLLMPQELM